jgi:defect-in-organelle-trafficking protein DotC
MSLIHKEKKMNSKRIFATARQRVYKNTLNAALIGVFGVFGVAFSPAASAADGVPLTLEQATKKSTEAFVMDPSASKDRDLRSTAMKEAAQSFGARSGLVRRTYEIRSTIEVASGHLDAVWNFRPLMLTDAQPGEDAGTLRQRLIVPPVVYQAKGIFKQEGPGLIKLVGQNYNLASNPRFSSVVPTWRDYLFRDIGDTNVVAPPHVSLMPRTPEEQKNWDRWIAEGWSAGVQQANDYLDYDLNRLQRDVDGMVLYHDLVAKKMLSLPHVATSNEPISGDENTLNINDSMLRITVMPAFQQDSSKWVPYKHGN